MFFTGSSPDQAGKPPFSNVDYVSARYGFIRGVPLRVQDGLNLKLLCFEIYHITDQCVYRCVCTLGMSQSGKVTVMCVTYKKGRGGKELALLYYFLII